jgi:LPS-assembly lipoprotein
MRFLRRLATCWFLSLLAACGFHLQGVAHLSSAFKVTCLQASDRYSDFHQALSQQLSTAGVQVVRQATDGCATVEIVADEPSQRVLSISATNIPTEYEVSYKIRYRVRLEGREVVPLQTLVLTRSYSFAESAALAKEREQQIIRGALAKELAALVMRRLGALSP